MAKSLIPPERIAQTIYIIRDQKVMLDSDLAELYQVETRQLNQAVKRNIESFPQDFAFQRTEEEFKIFKSQIVTSSWRGRRKPPTAFTELGVAMLSSVLRSHKARQVIIAIMRTFVRLRKLLSRNESIRIKIDEHDEQVALLSEYVHQLLQEPEVSKRRRIGFNLNKKDRR